jgi:hypothetical protein
MQGSLINLVAPFCQKVEKLPKCGNWQKCNYVTTISLHRTMKTPYRYSPHFQEDSNTLKYVLFGYRMNKL